MLHLCHLFSGPPRVHGRWALLRVLATAKSAAVSVAVCGPSDLPEVCPLRVCALGDDCARSHGSSPWSS